MDVWSLPREFYATLRFPTEQRCAHSESALSPSQPSVRPIQDLLLQASFPHPRSEAEHLSPHFGHLSFLHSHFGSLMESA